MWQRSKTRKCRHTTRENQGNLQETPLFHRNSLGDPSWGPKAEDRALVMAELKLRMSLCANPERWLYDH
jgi:hypothetical protein